MTPCIFPVPAIEPRFTGRPSCSVVPFRRSFPTQNGTVLQCFLNAYFDVSFLPLAFRSYFGLSHQWKFLSSLKTEAANLSEISLVLLVHTTSRLTRCGVFKKCTDKAESIQNVTHPLGGSGYVG